MSTMLVKESLTARGRWCSQDRPKWPAHGVRLRSGHDSMGWGASTRYVPPGRTNVHCRLSSAPMDKHFHVWTRAGKTFLMRDRKYRTRSHANKDAGALRPDHRDRMVRECEQCPESRRSRRRPPRWAKVAREVAEAVGADPAAVRTALADALDAERREREAEATLAA